MIPRPAGGGGEEKRQVGQARSNYHEAREDHVCLQIKEETNFP